MTNRYRIDDNTEHLAIMHAVGLESPTYWRHAARLYTPIKPKQDIDPSYPALERLKQKYRDEQKGQQQ